MATDRPLVSAIITAYNSARYIADAVASIRGQSVPPEEIIIIDDGSTDETGAIVNRLGADIRYVRRSNGGDMVARKHGVALARGEIIGFLDADDAWPERRMEHLLQSLKVDVDIVCGRARAFREGSWMAAAASEAGHPEGFLMSFGCSLIRRSIFGRVGSVEETSRHSSDLDWFLRCRELHIPIVVIDDIVLLYRRHDQNVTNDIAASRDRVMQAVKLSLERRRRGQRTTPLLPQWETLGRRQP